MTVIIDVPTHIFNSLMIFCRIIITIIFYIIIIKKLSFN